MGLSMSLVMAFVVIVLIRNQWVFETRMRWLHETRFSSRPVEEKIALYKILDTKVASYNQMMFRFFNWSSKMEDWIL